MQIEITQLLQEMRGESREAVGRLLPMVYEELKRIAHQHLARHRPGETLNTTALVHEAYAKLAEGTALDWQDRAHFFALASRAMRFILVDYVRQRMTKKRGGGTPDLDLSGLEVAAQERGAELLALDEALNRLAGLNERLSQVVDQHFFGGFTFVEIAELTRQSERTVRRDCKKAQLWLRREMQANRAEKQP